MSNRLCPKCGEEYSDTYRKCPFCEEEEAIRRGKPLRRRGGKRLSKKKRSSGAGGVMMTVLAFVVIGVVGYVYFGEQIAGLVGIRSPQDDQTQPGQTISDTQKPADDPAGSEDASVGQEPDVPVEPAGPLEIDHDTITIPSGETARLTVTGGVGEVQWSTSNENIAVVDGGAVTGVAGGTVTITAAAGEETVSCSVTITGDPWVNPITWKLNKEDFTFYSSDPDVQLKVKDCESPVVWASENTSIVTVSETGLVEWVGKGTTNVTATVDGQVLTCIVRCK